MNTRIAAVVALVVLLAGCTGGAYSFEANPASVGDDTLADAGYEGNAPEAFIMDETFEVAGVSADVTATSWSATYTNADRHASLVVASSPDATIAGQSVNPFVRLSDEALIERLLGTATENLNEDDVDQFEAVGSETRMILGTETEVTTFETTAETEHGEILIHIHVATVANDGDVIVLVGTHPADMDEKETILGLMEAVEH